MNIAELLSLLGLGIKKEDNFPTIWFCPLWWSREAGSRNILRRIWRGLARRTMECRVS